MPMFLILSNIGMRTSLGRNQPSKAMPSVTLPSPKGACRESISKASKPHGAMKLGLTVNGSQDSTLRLKQYPYTDRRPEVTLAAIAALAIELTINTTDSFLDFFGEEAGEMQRGHTRFFGIIEV